MSNNGTAVAYGWDDKIENPPEGGGDYVLLPEGVYPYSVTGFERADHNGSEKLPPCKKAVVTFSVGDNEHGFTTIKNNFFLHTNTIGIISGFLKSCGARKHGEILDLSKLPATPGRSGQCRIAVRAYTKKDGTPGQSNEIKAFLEPDDAKPSPTSPPPADPKPAEPTANWKADEQDDIPF